MHSLSRRTLLFLAALLISTVPFTCAAQTVNELLDQQKKEADTRKAVADAIKAEREALYPAPKTTPLTGETKITGADSIEAQLAGYVSMANATDLIAARIHEHNKQIKNLVIHNEADAAMLQSYSFIVRRIGRLTGKYDVLIKQAEEAIDAAPPLPLVGKDEKTTSGEKAVPIIGAITAATSIVGAAADLMALLRTNVTITNSTFDIGEPPLVSELFRSLRKSYGSGINLYYPAAVPPAASGGTESALMNDIERLYERRSEADERNARIAELVEAESKALTALGGRRNRLEILNQGSDQNLQATPKGDPDKLKTHIAALKRAVKQLPALNAEFDMLMKEFTTIEKDAKTNNITAYIRAENLNAIMAREGTYWLYVSGVKAGGSTRVKSHLFVDIFTGGSRISHGGGAIIQYNLFDMTGASLFSDTIGTRLSYMKGKTLARVVGENNAADAISPPPINPSAARAAKVER